MMILRNLLFYLGVTVDTAVFTLFGFLLFFLPYRGRYWLITRWSYFFIFWAKICCGLRYEVEGLENLPKESAIVLANHQSSWETIFFQILLPPQSWVIKRELLWIPGFGWTLGLLRPIAIRRDQLHSIKALLAQGKKRLAEGMWLVVFPEGTRSAVGKLHRFSRTGAALAEASRKLVVPIAHNAGEFWPRGVFIRKPGTIKVSIGPPIDPSNKSVTEINELAEAWIRNKIETNSVSI